MRVNNIFWSESKADGISIFGRHLRLALLPLGIRLFDVNLELTRTFVPAPVSLLHYVPSGFASPEVSRALVQLLSSRGDHQRILVVLHGLYGYAEDRFQNDVKCPDQARHIELMLRKAESILILSGSALEACRTWQAQLGGDARLVRVDHPGLFGRPKIARTRVRYAFLGGISRPKKDHAANELKELIDQCGARGIRIWQHWTNVQQPASFARAWRQTWGILNDVEWNSAVSHAQVVLCPYQTRVQSVSGLISEAISAQRFVLATSFESALEMRQRIPALIQIEDDVHRWPDIILHLLTLRAVGNAGVPTWDSFARRIADELLPAGGKASLATMNSTWLAPTWE